MYTALYRREGRARAGVGVGEQALRDVLGTLLNNLKEKKFQLQNFEAMKFTTQPDL